MLLEHIPVLTRELLSYLDVKTAGVYLDCTGGAGGHALKILEKLSDEGKLIIIDRDEFAVSRLREVFRNRKNVNICKANFKDVDILLEDIGIAGVDGIYADLGMSSFQVKDPERGFSFKVDGFLDMRMDKSQSLTAYDVINTFSEETLFNIVKKYGQEVFAKRIARVIVRSRSLKKINTTLQLANIIRSVIPKKYANKMLIDPATKTFQAIRIFVNGELESLEELLKKIEKVVNPWGRAVFISFHSLEDRLIKEKFEYFAKDCICPPNIPVCVCNKKKTFKILTKKPVIASQVEKQTNPLSRSAKLRTAERLP
mgnify:CR=1 FL=1|jgi:16S rRNA (cytosine1402-N4)-methyltransferase